MANVANALNALTSNRSDSGHAIPPESPESVLLSPNIKEAMDRILPKTASQLLQQGLSYEQNHSQNPSSMVSNMLPCSISTTLDATYSAKTTGLFSPASELSSCLASNQPADSPPTTPFNNLNCSSKDSDEKKKIGKLRISKADLEIITSASDIMENDNSLEVSSDPEDMTRCFSGVYREKRKHKKKKKRTKTSPERKSSPTLEDNTIPDEDTSSVVVSQKCVSSLGHFEPNLKTLTQPLGSRNNEMQDTLPVIESSFDSKLGNNVRVENRNCMNDCQNSIAIDNLPKNGFNNDCAIGNEDVSNISTSSSKENVISQRKPSGQRLPRTKRLEYNVVKHKSKIKNTFLPCFVVVNKCDSLPSQKVSNSCFDLSSNVLPLSTRVKALMELCNKGSFDCKKRKQKGVVIVDEPVYKNIFEENVLLGISDEEFENSLSRRNLRKRVKNISYVEPSEDDIIEDFSRKRSRSKTKDSGSEYETDASQENKKRKISDKSEKAVEKNTEKLDLPVDKLTNNKDVTSQPSDKATNNKNVTSPPEDNVTNNKDVTSQPVGRVTNNKNVMSRPGDKATNNKNATSIQEIIVFPPAPIVNGPDFLTMNMQKVSGSSDKKQGKSTSKKADPALPPDLSKYQYAPGIAYSLPAPASSRISVLSTPRFELLPPPPPVSVPVFSLHPSGYPSVITTMSTHSNMPPLMSALSNTLLRPPLQPSLQKHPQYCVMKVDGKDVLLQLVPSGSPIGASVLLPGGKKLVVDPTATPLSPPMLTPPLRSTTPISTQTVTVPVTVSAAPSNTISTAAFSNLLGLPLVSRNLNSTTSSIPLSGLPVISFSSVGGFSNPITTRPTFTSGTRLAQPSAHLTTTASLVSLIPTSTGTAPSAVRITNSTSTVSSSSLTTMASMTAPLSKTMRQNIADQIRAAVRPGLHAVAPNQTSSVRSIRIFVPGCTTTGIPGRFATLGSVANSSPLTRLSASSDLLPQRKLTTDHELTPEQKAAKRRKLEKKYPLPPGVVIKTEPLDNPPTPTAVQTTGRSLLSPNIQLVSSVARPGTTVRIIAPSLASALSSRVIRGGNHNFIYRSSTGGNHTVLVPTTLGHLTSVVTPPPQTSSSAVVTSAVTTTTTTALLLAHANTTSTNPTDISKQSDPLIFTSPSPKTTHIQSPSPAIWSPASSLSDKSSLGSSGTSAACSPATLMSTLDQPQHPPAAKQLTAESLEEFKISLIKFRELVQKQETLGLKGERLEKLKDILLKREVEFESMKTKRDSESNLSANILESCAVRNTENDTSATQLLGTETEPFVVE